LDELVFAIPATDLWDITSYKEKGFIQSECSVLDKLVQKGLFRNRNELEQDPSFKQIIPYAIISCKESYYLLQRSSKQAEKRLWNKFSLGVGGHMNPRSSLEPKEKYIVNELKRELFEEVKLSNTCSIESIEFIGLINDDTISVGSVHIGLVYIVCVSNEEIHVNETENMTAEWVEKPRLAEFYDRMETWGQITFDSYIKRFMI